LFAVFKARPPRAKQGERLRWPVVFETVSLESRSLSDGDAFPALEVSAVVAVGVNRLTVVGFLFHTRVSAGGVARGEHPLPVSRPDGEVILCYRQAATPALGVHEAETQRRNDLLVVEFGRPQ
jgi:hypothetical protein